MSSILEPWDEIPGCSVLFLWQNPDIEEFPYSFLGSGFLVSFHEQLFIVTAKHCLATRDENHLLIDRDVNLLRIPAHTNRPELFPISLVSRGPDSQDDRCDFAILTIAADYQHPREPGFIPPLDVARSAISGSPPPCARLTVRGFPHEGVNTQIDYERRNIWMQAASFGADYLGQSYESGMHRLRFIQSVPITNFNSMSGSPVFLNPSAPDQPHYQLAGMLLRAGGTLGHFLELGFVMRALATLAGAATSGG
jgi:hypothetical protein